MDTVPSAFLMPSPPAPAGRRMYLSVVNIAHQPELLVNMPKLWFVAVPKAAAVVIPSEVGQ